MRNEELEEKRLQEYAQNTVIRVEMTFEQAGEIYASLMYCAKKFRQSGNPDRADELERMARALTGE